MKTVDSLNLLRQLEIRTEAAIRIAVETLQNLSPEWLLKPSATGGWSIAQCLEHLNNYGDFYLPQIEKALHKNAHKHSTATFKSSWLGNYFTKMMLPDSGKKYKAFKSYNPPPDLDAAAVVATFIHQQELLLACIETAASRNLNTIRIPISIAPFIRLRLGDVFQFILAHNERHMQQALRNVSE